MLPTSSAAPTDFDFVHGDWSVDHRRLKERLSGCTEWVAFTGEMSTRPVLGGFGNVEDNLLHLPEGDHRAIAVRSYDAATGQWAIWWLDGRAPHQLDVPVVGAFEDGVGTFYADDELDGTSIRVRFVWRQISPTDLSWEQAFSVRGSDTWEANSTMRFRPRI